MGQDLYYLIINQLSYKLWGRAWNIVLLYNLSIKYDSHTSSPAQHLSLFLPHSLPHYISSSISQNISQNLQEPPSGGDGVQSRFQDGRGHLQRQVWSGWNHDAHWHWPPLCLWQVSIMWLSCDQLVVCTILVYSNQDNKLGLNRRETFIMQMRKILNKVLIHLLSLHL